MTEQKGKTNKVGRPKKETPELSEKDTKKEKLIKEFILKHRRSPPVLTPQQIDKLDYAFLHCANDREAYTYAGICESTFYYWQEVNPKFVEKKKSLREMVKFQARQNIIKGVNDGDPSASKWILERWNKEEFSLRVETTGKDGKDLIPDKIIRDDIKGDKE